MIGTVLTLVRMRLRRDRVALAVWVLVITALVGGVSSAVITEFGDPQQQRQLITLALSTPALLAFRGVPNGFSSGSIIWFQLFTWLALLIGLLNTFLATRHGRAEEQDGRRELLASTPMGRMAPMVSTLVVGIVVDLLIGVLSAAALVAVGQSITGAVTVGATFAVTGLLFLGIGLLAGELLPTARAANSWGVGIVLGSYVVRAAGDALGTADLAAGTLTPSWIGLLSPIGWAERTLALSANRAVWLVPGLVCAVAAIGVAAMVGAKRDLGASLVTERRGPATASPSLHSTLSLALRQQRGSVLGWALGAAVLGGVTGSLATAIGSAAVQNSAISRVLRQLAPGGDVSAQLVTVFTAAIMTMMGIVAAAAGVQAVLRTRAEETEGRAELLLALPVGRVRWMVQTVLIAIAGCAVVLLAAGLAAALSFGVRGNSAAGWRALQQAAVEFPAAAAVAAVAGLALSTVPRWAIGIGWGALGLAAVLALFGGLLSLPSWLVDISPFAHVPAVPLRSATALVVVATVGIVLVAATGVTARRREWTA